MQQLREQRPKCVLLVAPDERFRFREDRQYAQQQRALRVGAPGGHRQAIADVIDYV
eukprot:CAMPEP_0205900334 /NCGR_PEP_ID=MMETSP1083-20121108/27092_1 /ASSEMBLY_ACC=CAM_ASM_000430 /TAXON_ID=97485 /ORGANISM="Prymnesium parvum, Strain Texoma1" /LENGTH=55 /DNA_ID=CAMNT_0053265787 /DNA_START=1046 /DNA_END=1213 /DNA_ORIENTATION=+